MECSKNTHYQGSSHSPTIRVSLFEIYPTIRTRWELIIYNLFYHTIDETSCGLKHLLCQDTYW